MDIIRVITPLALTALVVVSCVLVFKRLPPRSVERTYLVEGLIAGLFVGVIIGVIWSWAYIGVFLCMGMLLGYLAPKPNNK